MAKGFCLNKNIRTKTLKQDKNDCTTYAAIALAKQYKTKFISPSVTKQQLTDNKLGSMLV